MLMGAGMRIFVLAVTTTVLSTQLALLQAAAPFYEGKTLMVVQGRSAGGLGDIRVRAAIPYLKKYLPEKLNFISIIMNLSIRPDHMQSRNGSELLGSKVSMVIFIM